MDIKQNLYNQCKEIVRTKLATIESTIKSNQEALASETKSSAGDKHETGRAMLQLEMEKAGKQLVEVSEMKETLDRIKISTSSEGIKLGSLVTTTMATFFISISAGELTIDSTKYYAVSSKSPIGKLLLGKKKTEKIYFNKKEINIIEVI